MMKFWRHHRRASRIASAMLLAWLFALVSSWANACLVQDRTPARGSAHASNERAVVAHAAGGHSHGHHGHEAPLDHDSSAARQLCQSLCDDGQTMPPKVVSPSVLDLGPPGLVPTEAWSFCAAQAQFPSGCRLAAAPPPVASVAIRFLRLTT